MVVSSSTDQDFRNYWSNRNSDRADY